MDDLAKPIQNPDGWDPLNFMIRAITHLNQRVRGTVCPIPRRTHSGGRCDDCMKNAAVVEHCDEGGTRPRPPPPLDRMCQLDAFSVAARATCGERSVSRPTSRKRHPYINRKAIST